MNDYSEAGILSAIVGNICVNIAINIQRHAKKQIATLAVRGVPRMAFRDRLWWLGAALLISGEFSNFIAYGLAPAAVVSPLGVFAVICNCIIPPLLFDEMPHVDTIKGTVIAMPGILLLILAAPGLDTPDQTPEFGPEAMPYLVANLIMCIILSLWRATTTQFSRQQFMANVCLGALMGSFSVLAVKALSLAIFYHRTEINAPLCLLILLTGGALQFSVLLETLQHFPMYQVIPHHFIIFTFLVTLGSRVLFHEFSISDSLTMVKLILGSLLSAIGVFVAARPHEHQPQPNRRSSPIEPMSRRASIASIHAKARVLLEPPAQRQRRRRNQRKRKQLKRIKSQKNRRDAEPMVFPPLTFASPVGIDASDFPGFSQSYADGFPSSSSESPNVSPRTSVPVLGERLPTILEED